MGLLAVHDLMSEAEVSGMVIGHTSCRVLLFTVLVDVNEGITLFSLALRKCNSTINTMLPTVTSNEERMGLWHAYTLTASKETGMARGDCDQEQ